MAGSDQAVLALLLAALGWMAPARPSAAWSLLTKVLPEVNHTGTRYPHVAICYGRTPSRAWTARPSNNSRLRRQAGKSEAEVTPRVS